jgi:predicted adenylyl cyclase CyaB
MIEVELRSFITSDQYSNLLQRFLKEGRLVEHTRQITYYLEHHIDTRIQVSTKGGRVWQKLGKMHDAARREYEVEMSRTDAETMLTLFRNLDFDFKVIWYRERQAFEVNGISVALDDTIGYGKILEVEIMCEESREEISRSKLLEQLHTLGVDLTDKEIFDTAFAEYLQTWRNRTAHLSTDWIDKL